jgi:tetratricopeptide (TPR) repeat protein
MPEPLGDKGEASDWYNAERIVLVATAELAGEAGFDGHGWQLAWAVRPYLSSTGHWQDLGVLLRIGLAAAGRLADPLALSSMRFAMANFDFRSGAYEQALAHAVEASRHGEAAGDMNLQADCHATQGFCLKRLGRLDEALAQAEQALELSRVVGNVATQVGALAEIGEMHARMGNPRLGVEYCRQAVTLQQDAEEHAWAVAAALDTMAHVQLQAGDVADAIATYRDAIGRLRQRGDEYGQAYSLLGLGDAHEADGNDAAAQEAWREGLRILGEMHHPHAERIRARLRQSTGSL